MYLIKPSFEILNFNCDLSLIERAGRTCYKSECKGEPEKFVKKICHRGHLSIAEHGIITVKIIADRGFLGQITRHRLCSFSVESSRYNNYKKKGLSFIIPPWVNIKPGLYEYDSALNTGDLGSIAWAKGLWESEYYYNLLIDRKWKPEEARSILPMALSTEFIMSANPREWKHIFELRCEKSTHSQMREIMIPLLKEFQQRVPVLFDNIKSDE